MQGQVGVAGQIAVGDLDGQQTTCRPSQTSFGHRNLQEQGLWRQHGSPLMANHVSGIRGTCHSFDASRSTPSIPLWAGRRSPCGLNTGLNARCRGIPPKFWFLADLFDSLEVSRVRLCPLVRHRCTRSPGVPTRLQTPGGDCPRHTHRLPRAPLDYGKRLSS